MTLLDRRLQKLEQDPDVQRSLRINHAYETLDFKPLLDSDLIYIEHEYRRLYGDEHTDAIDGFLESLSPGEIAALNEKRWEDVTPEVRQRWEELCEQAEAIKREQAAKSD